MDELDLFRNFRRGVAAPSPDAQRRASARLASALDEATGGLSRELACAPRRSRPPSRARRRGARRRRGRRPLPSAPCVTSSATGSTPVNVTTMPSKARGEPLASGSCPLEKGLGGLGGPGESCPSSRAPDVSSTVASTGQYVRVTGRGRVVRIGGHKQGWSARLEGFATRPGEAKQRVVITMKGRPMGVFALTPLEPGVLKRDSGTLIYTYATG